MRISIPKTGAKQLLSLAKEHGFTYNLRPQNGMLEGILLMKDCKVFARTFYAMGKLNFWVKV